MKQRINIQQVIDKGRAQLYQSIYEREAKIHYEWMIYKGFKPIPNNLKPVTNETTYFGN